MRSSLDSFDLVESYHSVLRFLLLASVIIPELITDGVLLSDGHNDLLILLRFLNGNHIYTPEFKDKFENGGMKGHVDLPRLDAGRVGGAFWSAFVPCPANGSDFSDANYAPCRSPPSSSCS